MYLYYYIFRQRSSLPLPVYICPYHTKMNKSLVPEWPCIIEVSYIYPPTKTLLKGRKGERTLESIEVKTEGRS